MKGQLIYTTFSGPEKSATSTPSWQLEMMKEIYRTDPWKEGNISSDQE